MPSHLNAINMMQTKPLHQISATGCDSLYTTIFARLAKEILGAATFKKIYKLGSRVDCRRQKMATPFSRSD